MQNKWDENITKKIVRAYKIKEWGYAIAGAVFLFLAIKKANIFDNSIILVVIGVGFIICSNMALYHLSAFRQRRRLMLFFEDLNKKNDKRNISSVEGQEETK